MIALRDVAIDIGGKPLLRNLTAHFSPGEFVALLGPNGAGKTTLLRALCGLAPIAGGSATINGDELAERTPAQRARTVALVAADDLLSDALPVREVVAIGRYAHHRWWEWREAPSDTNAIDRALHEVGIERLADRPFAQLSSGERQRVWIALGLAQQTPVLLLDEPTSHLDVRVAHDVLALLQRLARAGKTIVCVLHDLNDAAAYADTLALLAGGTFLALASPEAVFAGDVLERAYDVSMERVRIADGSLRVFGRARAT